MPNELLRRRVWQARDREEGMIDLVEIYHALRRRSVLMMGIMVAFIAAAVIYIMIAPARYTSTSMLFFDARKAGSLEQQGYSSAPGDSAFVDSQVEVLKSENLARSVVQQLDLASDPEFASPEFRNEGERLERVIRIFERNVSIKRIGLTYIVTISYRSLDPNKAARISNAVAEAYIAGELDSKSLAARRVNNWLQDRLRELRSQAEDTEQTVAAYKLQNSVANAGSGHISEQQLVDLSTQRRVVLRDLESASQTYRALHEKLLQRVAEFTQAQSFPASDARIVSAASPPLQNSEPNVFLILGVASLLGFVSGVGAAFAREHLDESLRSPVEVEKNAGVACLGVLPKIDNMDTRARWLPKRWPFLRRRGNGERGGTLSGLDQQGDNHNDRSQGREWLRSSSFEEYRFAIEKPLSAFGETIRSLKVAAELANPADHQKIVGVTSAMPREGKSIVAANLGQMIGASGSKVLLVDADTRSRAGLTDWLVPKAETGLMDAIFGNATLEDVLCSTPIPNMDFVPMVKPIPAEYHVGIGSPAAMRTLLQSVERGGYDYVIVDLPPINPVADVKAASPYIDHFIMVIEYGRTSKGSVLDALNAVPLVSEKLLGVVLNKTNSKNPTRASNWKPKFSLDEANSGTRSLDDRSLKQA